MISTKKGQDIPKPEGKLGVLMAGMGAISTTVIAGVEAIKRDIAKPIGSLTQMAHIRLGRRDEKRNPMIKEFVPLAGLEDMVFGGWDIFEEDCYEAALHAGVLEKSLIEEVKEPLRAIRPMKAVFDKKFVRKLDGPHVKNGASHMENAEALRRDIRDFQKNSGAARTVMIWCASTEIFMEEDSPVYKNLDSFEKALKENHPDIAPSMIYAYAALKEGVPFANGAPNLTAEVPALLSLALQNEVPVCGKDFKTGQTLMKTIIAPGLKARMLGIEGWFSTNILGNRDGEVLDDPDSFKTKEVSKLSVLDVILQPDYYPTLYKDLYHKVRINYYPPRGDAKEGWDNIDLTGFLGYKMQLKIDFLCRDSILAAPLVIDLALFLDLAKRAGMKGVQEWLSFYFKSPQTPRKDIYPEHDLFIQLMKLKNTLRHLMNEKVIHHLGEEYYA
ncbi:MAG: inositol-3-phosphate synthase [Nitrospinae bacterium]|nr:inositol-3-phosphate synthase [Nitrospinota bacterium]